MNKKASPLLSRFGILIFIFLSFLLGYFLRPPQPEILETQENPPQATKYDDFSQGTYHVARVLDGDTLELKDGTRVRYADIDAPEKNAAYGLTSTKFNQDLVGNKDVLVIPTQEKFDPYGRLLAYVYVGDIFVNRAMIEAGYARLLLIKGQNQPEKYDELKAAKDFARSRHLGIWLEE